MTARGRHLSAQIGSSSSQQRKPDIRSELLRVSEVDPQHCQRLEVATHGQWADVDRIETEVCDKRHDDLLGGRIIAGKCHHELSTGIIAVCHVAGARGAECFDNARPVQAALRSRCLNRQIRSQAPFRI
jgi:hypothetical protein